jgi:hypothetical protein
MTKVGSGAILRDASFSRAAINIFFQGSVFPAIRICSPPGSPSHSIVTVTAGEAMPFATTCIKVLPVSI